MRGLYLSLKYRGGVVVYLNGSHTAEIATEVTPTCPKGCTEVFVGGRCDNVCNFEGKISEAAAYGRALSADEVAAHFAAAGITLWGGPT